VRRFEREAQVIARLRSPHTVDLFDFGVAENGAFYYVMELLEGLDADTLVRRFGRSRPSGRSTSSARSALATRIAGCSSARSGLK
jgi:serine/threonine protein kinase